MARDDLGRLRCQMQLTRAALYVGCLLVCIARPSLAGPPLGPAAPALSLGLGLGAVAAAAAAVHIAGDVRADRLRARVATLDSPQLRCIDPEGRHFSVAELGEYQQCQVQLRALLAFDPVIHRPAPAPARHADESGRRVVNDNKFVQPVASRPVQVLDDRLKHWRAALTCEAGPAAPAYVLPPACVLAIDRMLGLGQRLPTWRSSQLRRLSHISARAARLSASLKRSCGLGLAANQLESRVRKVNVVMLMLLCDVLEHPDTALPRSYLYGFPVTGALPDSNVLRPQPPVEPEQVFWTRYNDTLRTNDQWAQQLAHQVSKHAQAASRNAKRLGLLRQAWALTKADMQAGFCGKPMTLAELRAKYGTGDHMRCRPIQRHGILQGKKQQRDAQGRAVVHPDGSPVLVDKIRLIDDSRRSLHNSHLMRTCETVAPCGFNYLAHVCDAVVRQARALGVPVPQVVFSTDDMR